MSGGERKKRGVRGTGWEEAGGEFYQESYPGAEIDFEAAQKDPHYFATLLPSKQNRAAAATARRPKGDAYKTYKRRNSGYYNTMGQNTVPNDAHVAMMPDLSENLANEESTWEEIMLIKSMPINMTQKKELKTKLLSAETFRLQGLKQLKWKNRKLWESLKVKHQEFSKKLELWRRCFRSIEGKFGTGVTSYFYFLKWLMLLNLGLGMLMGGLVIGPGVASPHPEDPCLPLNTSDCCLLTNVSGSQQAFSPLDVAQATGWLQTSFLFYGFYPSSPVLLGFFYYELPLAYIFAVIACFIVSLAFILKKASTGMKQLIITSDGQFYKYCNLIFCGWNFCICNDVAAGRRRQALFSEIKEQLEIERRTEDKRGRSKEELCKLFAIRVFVHCLVIVLLAAAGALIYFTIQFFLGETEGGRSGGCPGYRLLVEFVPSLAVVGLHFGLPSVITWLTHLERYSTHWIEYVMLARLFLLRATSFGVLTVTFYMLVRCPSTKDSCASPRCRRPACWESYLAQQIYKLILTEVAVQTLVTSFVNFPRMLLAKHIKCKLARILGSQHFDFPKHLVDLVYIQMLIWFGTFYFPMLPVIGTAVLFYLFYVKKFACLVNSFPSTSKIHWASRSNFIFTCVLFLGYLVSLTAWLYSVFEISPSKSCGPFRTVEYMSLLLWNTYNSLPEWIKLVISHLRAPYVLIPIIFVAAVFLVYYCIIAKSNRQLVLVLKKQLVLEGHDKQFLLNRLSAFIKQHQERHKGARSVDPPQQCSAPATSG